MLKESGLLTYVRGRRISAVIYGERNFRLKSLGFTEERLQGLEKTLKRTRELSEKRGETKEKEIRRKR